LKPSPEDARISKSFTKSKQLILQLPVVAVGTLIEFAVPVYPNHEDCGEEW